MQPWATGIAAVTMFVEDTAAAKYFYQDILGLPVIFEDEDSVVFKFGDVLVNLLVTTAAPELIAPAEVGGAGAGCRFQLTVPVRDVDALCENLVRRGVRLLNGPMDRPWGPRTASFQDPDGHIWELAQ
ncbi:MULTISPECIES: VOC family protein [unclassified Arthrobacter]|uniref:VOC family protein n=1 Tax=unclassified Arthrobacter TaxID=235627 RepID=UPI001E4EDBA5|nr:MULTISPECIES: VOC family protein [unclassified Arthrobacter]MCC9145457.1 VOC family protein [Arthrobacter sp. zg-Y919]MDK1276685.1 VOC family protein [Arthrobacter sp. zg.Y919]MDM7989325.1 VOC family protein [Arthrobacter sp. zg-Y877]WIB04369.1 VOC family protein [Arthrobacter sp. zg-Y919]